jgi:hypothetical protein
MAVGGLRRPPAAAVRTGLHSRFAESQFAESRFAESHFAESQFAESPFAESRFAEFFPNMGGTHIGLWIGTAQLRFEMERVRRKLARRR